MCIPCAANSVQVSEGAIGAPIDMEPMMKLLNLREYELVALGAAIASNCIPCIEYHIPVARNAGLTDAQILEAVQLADKLKQVPARKVLDIATNLLSTAQAACSDPDCGCAATPLASNDTCCG